MANTVKTHTADNYAAQQRRRDAETKARNDKRNAYIKAIKTKQRQLGMDDETYRAMLLARTGKTSAKDCTLTELGVVSGYLSSQGAVAPKAEARAVGKTRPGVALERQALRGKVSALMVELVSVTDITDTVKYVNAICQKNGWCSAIDFADPHILHKLVGALSRTLANKKAKARQAAQA
jgi:hypothetical protein